MKPRAALLLAVLVLAAPACSAKPTPDLEATVFAAFAATQAAQPTATPIPEPTATPIPTWTSTPTATVTNTPTPTPPADSPASREPVTVVTSTLENGWILYEVPAEGFAIALPLEWLYLELSPDGLADALSVVGELNPEVGSLLSSDMIRSLAASGIKFYAMDLSLDALEHGAPPSVNVLKLDIGMVLPLDSLVELALPQLRELAIPGTSVTHQLVSLSNVDAEEIRYTAQLTGVTGQSQSAHLVQYLVLDGSINYTITLAGPSELADDHAPVFKQIAQSFRLLD
jgi:hypothetical protein